MAVAVTGVRNRMVVQASNAEFSRHAARKPMVARYRRMPHGRLQFIVGALLASPNALGEFAQNLTCEIHDVLCIRWLRGAAPGKEAILVCKEPVNLWNNN